MTGEGTHPYRSMPAGAFWSRSVSRGFDPRSLVDAGDPLIKRDERIVSAGSCFASNIVPYLDRAGLRYLRTETMHASIAQAIDEPIGPTKLRSVGGRVDHLAEMRTAARRALLAVRGRPPAPPSASDNFGYASFSAAYGNIYTTRQLLQLLHRATGRFHPVEDRWRMGDRIVDPYRPGLRYPSRTDTEFDMLSRQHLRRTKEAFEAADVFVLTLGLTEAWLSTRDGAVFPACPGTVAGTFDETRHRFHNFTAAEVAADLCAFIEDLRAINATCRFVISVSPVPLVATATGHHVLCASTYSKSALRVAATEAATQLRDVTYFPAYEIVTGPQAPRDFMAPDRRNVTAAAVETVMTMFLGHCETGMPRAMSGTPDRKARSTAALSAELLDADCEEAMSGR